MDGFISEDDLLTFEGFLRYQAVDPTKSTPEELEMWRGYFTEATRRRESGPKVGVMKLQPVPGEQKYAVALRDGSDLWLTMWVRCSRRGEIFILFPRPKGEWHPHASYHLDGTFHHKSYDLPFTWQKRQPLNGVFRGIEYLGSFGGHGKSSGAVCDPKAFDGVAVVEPGILGPIHGSVVIDLVEPGYEPKSGPSAPQRRVFPRGAHPSVVITICPGNRAECLIWPDDFGKAA